MRLIVWQGKRKLAINAQPGEKLSQAIWISGAIAPQPLCNGLGLCGRCRTRFLASPPPASLEDLQKLSPSDLEEGWRLACHHTVPDCETLELELPCVAPLRRERRCQEKAGSSALGIDFGTTSIHWQAVKTGEPQIVLQQGELPNPQAGAGPDVISRLAYALQPGGEATLSRLGRQAISAIVGLMEDDGLEPAFACIAANSAMTEILLQKDVAGLASAPYQLSYQGDEIIDLDLPGIKMPLQTLIPPLPAPFVGGDIAAGILALADRKRPFLLTDLGTNAELALLDNEGRLYLASAPLGPALEGIGPACGQPAGPGVITGFSLTPKGIEISGEELDKNIQGISATGYLALLALLLRMGAMRPNGQIDLNAAMPLVRKYFRQMPAGRLDLPGCQYLASADIELLLKAKSAFRTALDQLLQFANLPADALAAVYLAGALGEHAHLDDLADLGFLPPRLAAKTIVCGNASLLGACILAAKPEKLADAAALCANAQILQLAEQEEFYEGFIAGMRWGEA